MSIKKTFSLFNLILFVVIITSCHNTVRNDSYVIEGVVKNYEGKIYLFGYATPKYYFDNFKMDSAMVVNDKFEFKLAKESKFPLPFYLLTENDIMSERFILEPKNQKIIIDSLYFKVRPRIITKNSTINHEIDILFKRRKPFLETFKANTNAILSSDIPMESHAKLFNIERDKLTYKSDSVLVDFAKEYPNSFFSFWEIVIGQTGNGYSKEIEKAFNNLSDSIKETKIAKLFLEDLKNAKSLYPGNYFPKINLKNGELEGVAFNANENFEAEYILIDFWFSYCSPCIAQFPRLKGIYAEYHPKGLEIIGISTDKTSNIDNWNKTIDKHEIDWINLLDENGVESIKLSVNKFPTNFLLNRQRIILKKDISLDELEKLLIEYSNGKVKL